MQMLLFQLEREEDPSGVSGTGVVAQGVIFDDGSVATRWIKGKTSTGVWDCLQDVIDVHGHGGLTFIKIITSSPVFNGEGSPHVLDA
jgi:hypothetical protein